MKFVGLDGINFYNLNKEVKMLGANAGVYDFNIIREHLERLRQEEEKNKSEVGVTLPESNKAPEDVTYTPGNVAYY